MKRTDLALEVRESIPQDNKEVRGVVLEKTKDGESGVEVTRLVIKDAQGAKTMGKPIGTYITVEVPEIDKLQGAKEKKFIARLKNFMRELVPNMEEKSIFIVGLGNREITPDALGPQVVDSLFTTRHLIREFGEEFKNRNHMNVVTALAPGVMAQTGMESREIIKGIVEEVRPDLIIVIDALAARSVKRLNCTIQLTDTGISPGSGVGNNRNALNRDSLGIPVVAIGVPTVVDAGTIVEDHLEQTLQRQGFSEQEIFGFINEVNQTNVENMFVTPKNVDEAVKHMSYIIAEALNDCFVPENI